MTTDMKHTPGPWERTKLTVHTRSTADRPALAVARVLEAGIETEAAGTVEQATANAALIAAAPELLEALRDAREALNRLPDVDGAFRVTCLFQADAAIRKATGG